MVGVPVKAKVKVVGDLAIIEVESGGKAAVPLSNLCSVAKKLNLHLVNYSCDRSAGGSKAR